MMMMTMMMMIAVKYMREILYHHQGRDIPNGLSCFPPPKKNWPKANVMSRRQPVLDTDWVLAPGLKHTEPSVQQKNTELNVVVTGLHYYSLEMSNL